MSRKRKVFVISLIDFSVLNGGVICSTNLLENMHQISDVDLTLVSGGDADAEVVNSEFAARLQLDHVFLQRRETSNADRRTANGRIAATALELVTLLSEKYYFFYEQFYRKQKHLDVALKQLISREKPDLIVIDGSWSAFCVPSVFSLGRPCCLVIHNHEVDIHKDFKTHAQGTPVGTDIRSRLKRWIAQRFNWIPNMRFRRHIDRLYKQCTGVIALTSNDLPHDLPAHILRAILPPLLKESSLRWTYHGRRCVLFVGNIGYFANRLAIGWLCSKFAPEMLRIDNRVRINIIGATADDVDGRWQFPNVNFLGNSDKEEVIRHMMADDLLIAPTAQAYGAKLKLAECASHGMPFIATSTAMGGLPFLPFVPRVDLEKPDAAAHLVLKYINSPELLSKLSQAVTERMERARREQVLVWSSFIKNLLTQPNPLGTGRPEEARLVSSNGNDA